MNNNWYKKSFRRHLCDMHIHDWSPEFLSEFSPEEYVENLKRAKIQSAMIYFQSHVGLCYYPTKSGKMHAAFIGKEDMIKRVVDLCHKENISVVGYYSLIYNNWAHDAHPEWRLVDSEGYSMLEANKNLKTEFSDTAVFRYGHCCPNNKEYRSFVLEQITEISEYFEFEGLFFDMLFWPQMCYCDSCRERWKREVGGEIPVMMDWNNPRWLLHIAKRREWMGEFAAWVTKNAKELVPGITVEHNASQAVSPNTTTANAEGVLDACDYVGGDLYSMQSFACKLYYGVTHNQPFEFMFGRCEGSLSRHTLTKSTDKMKSQIFICAAHHGATLVIDAIDPVGTLDKRLYEKLGSIFEEEIPYEKYYIGELIEEVGVYYSHRSKFNSRGEPYTNHKGATNTVSTLIYNNIPSGVTGGFRDISGYKILIAPCLTSEDEYDNERIAEYVRNGGNLYFSGSDNAGLLNMFFGAECTGRTVENIVYVAPNPKAGDVFDYFNEKYPMHFEGTAPIVKGFSAEEVIACITLPYTAQNSPEFVSIHSNPPGKKTDIPAVVVKQFGKGRVVWSALPFECLDMYDYRRIFVNLLKFAFDCDFMVSSDAPEDVEIVGFKDGNNVLVSAVLHNEGYKARKLEEFGIRIKSDTPPKAVKLLPYETDTEFDYTDGTVSFEVKQPGIFAMYKVCF